MMKAVINADGSLRCIVYDPQGHDEDGTVIDAPENPDAYFWDGSQFVPRPPNEREVTRTGLKTDARWEALKDATPAQIDAWLNTNVTTLAQARQVLGLLLKAMRVLASDGRFD
jgi:hypothetical protein